MKKLLYLVLFSLLFWSCKQNITNKDISKINGYWEIEKVILKNGDKKDYKVNETIDYFEIKNNKGFRKKVMPQLDGTYKINNVEEAVLINNSDETYFINYVTPYGKWKEEIITIEDSILVLKSKDELEYHYKRNKPFSLK